MDGFRGYPRKALGGLMGTRGWVIPDPTAERFRGLTGLPLRGSPVRGSLALIGQQHRRRVVKLTRYWESRAFSCAPSGAETVSNWTIIIRIDGLPGEKRNYAENVKDLA